MNEGRIRIVHVVFSFHTGGLENGVVNLINHLPTDQFEHIVVSLTSSSPSYRARVQHRDVEFIDLQKPPGHGFKVYPRLLRLFRELAPQVVHTRNLAALEAVVPARFAGVPLIVHGEHGWDTSDPSGESRKYQFVRRLYAPFVSRYVALSGQIEGYLIHRVGVRRARIERICNGVDTYRFTPPPAGRSLLTDGKLNESRFLVIGTVGRLQVVKDQLNLVRAFALLMQQVPDHARRLRLMIVGDGPLRSTVEAEIEHLHLGERVWLAGERSDMPEVMRAMDLFVLPSRTEGISNTILEAMACGLPVVATRVGGNAELVEHGLTGVLVPPSNSQILASAMAHYVRDDALRSSHGAAGRSRAQREFSIDGMISRYRALYIENLRLADVGGRGATAFLGNFR